MPRGGYRPGAGRPKGSKTLKADATAQVPAQIRTAALQSGLTPLDYMLEVMRDETADPDWRLRMAIAAAPYVHAKPADLVKGKKEAAEEAAETAGHGTDWGDDLAGFPLHWSADNDN